MKHPVLAGIVVLAGALLTLYTSVLGAESDSVADPMFAVMECEMPGGASHADNWAPGLADLMETAMQTRGLTILTRRCISLVLNERRLVRTGMVGDAKLVRENLPDVDFLVKGSISWKGTNEFDLAVRVLNAHSGTEVQVLAGSGRYPKDILPVMEDISAKLAAKYGTPKPVAQTISDIPGMTRIPEVAVTFYRGIEHYMAGRPAYALDCFRMASALDPAFPVAVLWHMRAYEALGLRDHAAIEFERLLKRPAADLNVNTMICGAHQNYVRKCRRRKGAHPYVR